MLQHEILVGKLLAIYGFAARAVVVREISTLATRSSDASVTGLETPEAARPSLPTWHMKSGMTRWNEEPL